MGTSARCLSDMETAVCSYTCCAFSHNNKRHFQVEIGGNHCLGSPKAKRTGGVTQRVRQTEILEKAPLCRGAFCFVLNDDPLQQNAAQRAARPEQAGHEKVLLPAGVDAPEHGQADARARAQPGEQAAEADRALGVQLRKQHAGRAVGDEPDQRGRHRLEHAHVEQESRDGRFADPFKR